MDDVIFWKADSCDSWVTVILPSAFIPMNRVAAAGLFGLGPVVMGFWGCSLPAYRPTDPVRWGEHLGEGNKKTNSQRNSSDLSYVLPDKNSLLVYL